MPQAEKVTSSLTQTLLRSPGTEDLDTYLHFLDELAAEATKFIDNNNINHPHLQLRSNFYSLLQQVLQCFSKVYT